MAFATAFQADAFQNDAFQITDSVPVPPAISHRAVGGGGGHGDLRRKRFEERRLNRVLKRVLGFDPETPDDVFLEAVDGLPLRERELANELAALVQSYSVPDDDGEVLVMAAMQDDEILLTAAAFLARKLMETVH